MATDGVADVADDCFVLGFVQNEVLPEEAKSLSVEEAVKVGRVGKWQSPKK